MSFDEFRELAVDPRMGKTEAGESTTKGRKEKIKGGESKKEAGGGQKEERNGKT